MIKKTLKREIPSLFISLLCSCCLFIYIPLVSFWGNANQFAFDAAALLRSLVLPLGCCFVALLAATVLVNKLFVKKELFVASKGGAEASPVHILIAVIIFCLWLEGFLLNKGLAQVTGERDLYTSAGRMVFDSIVWLALIACAIKFWRTLAKRLVYLSVALAMLFVLGLADAYLGRTEPAHTQVTSYEVLDQATLSSEDNVMVVVLDAMSTALIQDHLATNPDAYNDLDGFTFFENNIEGGSSTQWSLPSMLTGELYTGGPALEYQERAITGDASILRIFHDAGYDVYCSSTIPLFNAIELQNSEYAASEREVVFSAPLYSRFFLRFSPYVFKNTIANRLSFDANDSVTSSSSGGNMATITDKGSRLYDERAYLALMNAATEQRAENPTLNFHHVKGAHMPYVVDSEGNELPASESHTLYGLEQQSAWTMQYVQAFLQTMKDAGIYDSTTIVLLGDHGDRMVDDSRENMAYAGTAGLLIKPANAHGDLAVSSAAMSNLYLADFLTAMRLKGATLEELTADLPSQRSTFNSNQSVIYVFEGADVTTMQLTETIPVEQIYEPNTLSSGTQYSLSALSESINIAYPLEYTSANYTNGWGLKALDKTMEVSFRVDASPGAKVEVALAFETSILGGGTGSFVPYTITIQDQVSGMEHSFVIDEAGETLTLEGVTIGDDSTLRLSLAFSNLEEHLQYFMTQIEYN